MRPVVQVYCRGLGARGLKRSVSGQVEKIGFSRRRPSVTKTSPRAEKGDMVARIDVQIAESKLHEVDFQPGLFRRLPMRPAGQSLRPVKNTTPRVPTKDFFA